MAVTTVVVVVTVPLGKKPLLVFTGGGGAWEQAVGVTSVPFPANGL
jgi:hypothetical protein